MAKLKPPKVDLGEIPKVPEDELDLFLERVRFRIRNNITESEKGKLNAQWVAFEALDMLLPAMEAGADHEMLKAAYPVKQWREDTAEVPMEVLKALVSAWKEYVDSGKTLGQAFGFEALNRQGSTSMKAVSEQIDKKRQIAARALVEHTQIGEKTPISRESAISKVAQELNVSESTVERAYREFGNSTYETLKALKDLDFIPGKTSRSDAQSNSSTLRVASDPKYPTSVCP